MGKTAVSQTSLEIFNKQEIGTINYCKDKVPAAPEATIAGRDLYQENDGIKVSIANYIKGEDMLHPPDNSYGLKIVWNNEKGELVITGNGTAEAYTNVVRSVLYQNLAAVPTPNARDIVVTLSDADFLPKTQHFYQFISAPGIRWDTARDSAANRTYNGLRGYLVTITSKEENDFIWEKTRGVGWIGASDAEDEGTVEARWIWVTGPEAGTVFWKDGYTIPGMYSNWNTGEPNNLGKEDYAHINYGVGLPGAWNDLSITGDTNPNSDYHPRGYIVEYGGLENVDIKLFATHTINIAKIPFYGEASFDLCRGSSLKLSVKNSDLYTYEWIPDNSISTTTGTSVEVFPDSDITYKMVTKSINDAQCIDTAYIAHVALRELPVSELPDTFHLCLGNNVPLSPGSHSSYQWSTGATTPTIMPTEEGEYRVILKNQFGCLSTDTTIVIFNKRPEISFDPSDTLVCGMMEQTFNFHVKTEEAITTLLRPLSAAASIVGADSFSPIIKVNGLGRYLFNLEITNQNQCVFDSIVAFTFAKRPEAAFNIDSTSCYGYNLQVEYQGEWNSNTHFSWYSADTIYAQGFSLTELAIPLGADPVFSDGINRSVGLLVEENGCSDFRKVNVKVRPEFEIYAVINTGCAPFHAYLNSQTPGSAVAWHWDFGDGETDSQKYTNHIYVNESNDVLTFNVFMTITASNGCENTAFLPKGINVNPKPLAQFSFSPDIVYLTDPYVEFSNKSENATGFSWNFGDGNTSNDSIPRHRYSDFGIYNVLLTAYNNWGCTDTISRNIMVTFDKIFVPNAFSPNSSNDVDKIFKLDVYGVSRDGYSLRIYNRWGEMIFESTSPETGWEGKLKNGSYAQSGNYTWVLQYVNIHNERRKQQGNVLLLY